MVAPTKKRPLGVFFHSSISSNAIRTAAITKAEKVQSFPSIAFSTEAITSSGKRMVLFVVDGELGIWNFAIITPRNTFVLLLV